jgi:hypothetical protein
LNGKSDGQLIFDYENLHVASSESPISMPNLSQSRLIRLLTFLRSSLESFDALPSLLMYLQAAPWQKKTRAAAVVAGAMVAAAVRRRESRSFPRS